MVNGTKLLTQVTLHRQYADPDAPVTNSRNIKFIRAEDGHEVVPHSEQLS